MTSRRLHLVAALSLVMLVPACSGPGGGMRHGGGERRSAQDGSQQRPLELARMSTNDQIRLRLTDVRIALNLKPEQAAVWQAYENKVLEILLNPGGDAGASTGVNAVNQIDRRAAAEQNRAAAMEQLAAAARKLYSTLTDEQKRTADRMLASTVPVEVTGVATPVRGGR